jgi:nascent polypeptide-associated complex subunit alpha
MGPGKAVEEEKGTTRAEKKARKAISKLGLKPVPGVERVTMKKSKHLMFVISNPDVYKSPSDSYIIFGEAKIEDIKAKEAAAAAEQYQNQRSRNDTSRQNINIMPGGSSASSTAVGSDENVDETGVDAKDIELVISQANCSRAQAVKALKNNDNDIVNAIMELTM